VTEDDLEEAIRKELAAIAASVPTDVGDRLRAHRYELDVTRGRLARGRDAAVRAMGVLSGGRGRGRRALDLSRNQTGWPAPRRRAARKRALGAGTVVISLAAVVSALSSAGGGTPAAFAGWTSDPTVPRHGQREAALAACHEGGPPTVTDTRGPFSLLLFVYDDTPQLCISGPSFSGAHSRVPDGAQGDAEPIAADSLVVRTAGAVLVVDPSTAGASYRVIDGQIGSDVTAVTIILSDGSTVNATAQNGWFTAWWPGTQGADRATLSTTAGAINQPLAVSRVGVTGATQAGPEAGGAGSTGATAAVQGSTGNSTG